MAPFYEIERNILGRVVKERELKPPDRVILILRGKKTYDDAIIVDIETPFRAKVLIGRNRQEKVEVIDPKSGKRTQLKETAWVRRQHVSVSGQGFRSRHVKWRS